MSGRGPKGSPGPLSLLLPTMNEAITLAVNCPDLAHLSPDRAR